MTAWLTPVQRTDLFHDIIKDMEGDILQIETHLAPVLPITCPNIKPLAESIPEFCLDFALVQNHCLEKMIARFEVPKEILSRNFEEHMEQIEGVQESCFKYATSADLEGFKTTLSNLTLRLENIFKTYLTRAREIEETIEAVELVLNKTPIVTKLFDAPQVPIFARFPFSVVNLLDPSLQGTVKVSSENELRKISAVYKKYVHRLYYFKHCVSIGDEIQCLPSKIRALFA